MKNVSIPKVNGLKMHHVNPVGYEPSMKGAIQYLNEWAENFPKISLIISVIGELDINESFALIRQYFPDAQMGKGKIIAGGAYFNF